MLACATQGTIADQPAICNLFLPIPDMGIEKRELSSQELKLDEGRSRMPNESVYMFLQLRVFLGSLSTKQSRWFLRKSMSLYGCLQHRILRKK